MSDYLFDKQGEPDPEIAHLERVLRPLAHRGAPLLLPRRRPRLALAWISTGAVAACALIVLLVWRPWRPTLPALATWIETGARTQVLRVGAIGTVELGAHTRARAVGERSGAQVIELRLGTLAAKIDAPPRRFVVETPRARVIDLGCAFEVTVDEQGKGSVHVTAGQVAVADGQGHELTLAAGSAHDLSATPAPSPAPALAPAPAPAPILPKHSSIKHTHKSTNAVIERDKATAAPPPPSPSTATSPTPTRPATKPAAKPNDSGVKLQHDPFKDFPR